MNHCVHSATQWIYHSTPTFLDSGKALQPGAVAQAGAVSEAKGKELKRRVSKPALHLSTPAIQMSQPR